MIFNVTYDQNTNSLPAGFTSGIAAAVNFLSSQISTPIVFNLHVGFGEVGGTTLPSNALGESSTGLALTSYSQLRAALIAHATSTDDNTSTANLPSADPTNGGTVLVAQAEAVVLGLLPSSTPVNASIGFNSTAPLDYDRSNGISAGQYDFYGVVLHEITETLGRILSAGAPVAGLANAYLPLDFFHYSAPGVRTFAPTQGAYFSPDNGVTNLGTFNTVAGADLGDWSSVVGPDSLSAIATKGVLAPFTQSDLRVMDVLGYTLGASSAIPTLHAPVLQAPALTNNNKPMIVGTADANDQITLFDKGSSIGSTTALSDGTFKFVPNTALADGSHVLTATAIDPSGAQTPPSAPVTIVIDTMPPAAPVLQVPNVTKFNEPLIAGTAEGNSSVTLFDGSTKLGSATASSAGMFSFTPSQPLADGTHSITATATDAASNVSQMAPSSLVQIDTATPVDHLGTNGNDTLIGSGTFYGGAGDDLIFSTTGVGTSIYSGPALSFAVTITAGSGTYVVHDKVGTDGTDTLITVPLLQFTDQTIDTSNFLQTAALPTAQLTQLVDTYIAYFNRAPDAMGLSFWGGQLSKGVDFPTIANDFAASPEARAAYPSTQGNSDFVTAVYENVLGRSADATGFSFWAGQLQSGGVTKGDFVLSIVQSVLQQSGTVDAQHMANKYAVGAHFALTEGLSDGALAKTVMSGVDGSAASVTSANAVTDGFAATAATAAGTDFVVKILGIVA